MHKLTPYYQVGKQAWLTNKQREDYYNGVTILVRSVTSRLKFADRNIAVWKNQDNKTFLEERILSWYELVQCFPNLYERPPLIAKIYWQRFFEIEAVLQFRRLCIGIDVEYSAKDYKEIKYNLKELTTHPVIKNFIRWMKYERWKVRNPDKSLFSYFLEVENIEPTQRRVDATRDLFTWFEELTKVKPTSYKLFQSKNEMLFINMKGDEEDEYYDS